MIARYSVAATHTSPRALPAGAILLLRSIARLYDDRYAVSRKGSPCASRRRSRELYLSVIGKIYVLRTYVSMEEASRVNAPQRIHHGHQDLQRQGEGYAASLLLQVGLQRYSVKIARHHIGRAVGLKVVANRHDARMILETSKDLRFMEETAQTEVVKFASLSAEDLNVEVRGAPPWLSWPGSIP